MVVIQSLELHIISKFSKYKNQVTEVDVLVVVSGGSGGGNTSGEQGGGGGVGGFRNLTNQAVSVVQK